MSTNAPRLASPEELLAHSGFLPGLVRHLVHEGEDADDYVQETLVVALDRRPRAGPGLKSWLGRVARNVIRQDRRARGRRRLREEAAARADRVPSAAEAVARERARRRVVDAVMALAEPYRATVVLRYLEALSPREIARHQDVPVETVRTRLKRARAMLRDRFDRESDGDRAVWLPALLPLLRTPGGSGPDTAGPLATAAPGLRALPLLVGIAAVLVAVLTLPGATPATLPAPPGAFAAAAAADEPAAAPAAPDAPEGGDPLAFASAAAPAALLPAIPPGPAAAVDAYEIAVKVLPGRIEVRTTLRLGKSPKGTVALDLAAAMEVTAVRAGGADVPFEREGEALAIDLSKVADDVPLVIEAAGTPHNRFSKRRGGFLRTAVKDDIAWIRSQYAWYPRSDGAASYRIVVDAPADREVRTAGDLESVEAREGRRVWTFATSAPVRRAGLVAGPWTRVDADGRKGYRLEALVFPGDEEGGRVLLSAAARALDHFAGRFGPIESGRFTLVEMPTDYGETSGYGEDGYVLVGRGAFGGAEWADRLVAHEISHSWWGHRVGFCDFASEALASWSTLGFVEATRGAEAAREVRRGAVERTIALADANHEVPLGDIRGFGGGMDARTYQVLAYEKGMMVLSMAADAVGREDLDRRLERFLDQHAGEVVGWTEVAEAVAGAGAAARAVVEQWSAPGVPTLTLESETKKAGSRCRVKGTLTQSGTGSPYRMEAEVVATAGGKETREAVELRRKEAGFTLTLDGEPESLTVDPDWRLLVRAPRDGPDDAKKILEAALAVVNSPNERDRAKLEGAIGKLRGLLAAGAGDAEGLCHTGIGRCLYRLERYDEAKAELEEALRLGAGGPFHRGWVLLRLGCIADHEGDRGKARELWQRVLDAPGASEATRQQARRYLEGR